MLGIGLPTMTGFKMPLPTDFISSLNVVDHREGHFLHCVVRFVVANREPTYNRLYRFCNIACSWPHGHFNLLICRAMSVKLVVLGSPCFGLYHVGKRFQKLSVVSPSSSNALLLLSYCVENRPDLVL